MFKKPLTLYAALVFIVSFVVLWVFRSHQQFADGLSIALSAKDGKDLFDVRSVLFPGLIHVLYKVVGILTHSVKTLDLAAFHNTFFASITVTCLFLMTFKFTRRYLPGMAAATALMATGGFWLFVPLADGYIPSQAMLAVASLLLLVRRFSIFNKGKWWAVALCIVGAALYHISGLLFLLPLLLFTAVVHYKLKWQVYGKILGSTLIVLLIVNYLIFALSQHTISIVSFVNSSSSLPLSYPDYVRQGALHNFSIAGLHKFAEAVVAGIFTVDSRDAMEGASWFGLIWGAIVLGSFVAAWFGKTTAKPVILLLASWLMVYSLFIMWLMPGYQLISLMLFPLWAMVTYFISRLAQLLAPLFIPYITATCVLFLLGCTVLINNFNVFDYYHNGTNIGLREAGRFEKLVGDSGLIITNYNTQTYLRYYFNNFNNIENVAYLGSFYDKVSLPEKFRPNPRKKLAIAFWHFGPWYDLNGRNGWVRPCEWRTFANSLMDIKDCPHDSACYSSRKCYAYRGINHDDDVFLVFDTARYYFKNPAQPYIIIDSVITRAGISKDAVLKQWFYKNDTVRCN